MTGRAAVFLDRDGTLIEDVGYLSRPDQVRLMPGAADAVVRFRGAGLAVIVVTNQSGIARGLLDWPAYQAVAAKIDELLVGAGTRIDATYVCPHHPDFTGPCECRKPQVKLYRDAAAAHGLDLARSIWIGDRVRDVAPSRGFGGRGILVGRATGSSENPDEPGFPLVVDLAAAADLALAR